MNGLIALLGAGEYLPIVDPIDRYLLDSLGTDGRKPRVVCLATAAGKEGDDSINRWQGMGVEHFERLGAEVFPLRIIDRDSADDPQYESTLESADLIYFSGGDPNYLYETMQGSRAWNAAQKAWTRGAIYAGCSAGAMILAQRMPNFRAAGIGPRAGFGVVPAAYVLPHFDKIPAVFRPVIFASRGSLKDGEFMFGIEENTALVGKLGGEWQVMGVGKVHVIQKKTQKAYASGEKIVL
ncbi:MAG TPA: Type 1 glutamine amidotransferase-like domain-containing protein [Anaerolineales bacterium]|nr:Type 1 glutamine amidotransferase-like domain-containing protein [Anaerolineales bacterium]